MSSTFRLAAFCCFGLLFASLFGLPAEAAELRLHYRAMEKLLVAKFFDEEGRRYLQGSGESKCSHTYLANPEISAAEGRLLVRVTFFTRVGVELRGECVGTTDSFPTIVSGVPAYRNGNLELADLQVDTEGRGYGEALRPLVNQVMSEGLRFPLQQRIEESSRRVWEETGARMSVPMLEVGEIRLEQNMMLVPLDFRVVLR